MLRLTTHWRRALWLGSVALVIVVLSGGGWYMLRDRRQPVTAREFEQWIDASLPPGTPKQQVEAWLKTQGILYAYDQTKNEIDGVTGTQGRLFPPELGGRVELYFFFDDHDKLTKRMVKKQTYSS